MDTNSSAFRLKVFMDHMGLSNSQFADECGIPRPTLSQLLSGRNKKLSDQILRPIHRKFPQLSLLWLMFGEGDMLSNSMFGETNSSFAEGKSSDIDTPAVDFIDYDEKGPSLGEDVDYKATISRKEVDGKITNVVDHVDKEEGNEKSSRRIGNESFSRQRVRRVRSVVVYYDDNTYETFLPGDVNLSFPS